MRITCPDTHMYHRPSPHYTEWSKSAASQLRRLMPLSVQSRHLDYQMDTTAGSIVTTPSDGAKVVYNLSHRPIKSSAQDIIECGCLVWLSLCLAGLLSLGLTQYLNLAYSEFATAVVMNVMDILITIANFIVAVISGVLAFVFVKILATPFRRYGRRQRRGKYRRLSGHTLGHNTGDIKIPFMSPRSIESLESDVSIPEAKLQASGDCDATEETVDPQSILLSFDIPSTPDDQTQEDEISDNKVNLAPLLKSKSLPCLYCLALKSANPSPSRHSLPGSDSLISVQCSSASFSISCKKEERSPTTNKPVKVKKEITLTNKPVEVPEESSSTNKPEDVKKEITLTNKPVEVTEESSSTNKPEDVKKDVTLTNKHVEITEEIIFTNKSLEVTEESSLTNKPVDVIDEIVLTNKPVEVTEESSLTNKSLEVTKESSLTKNHVKVTEECTDGRRSIGLPRSSESSTSISSTFTIESLPEELPGGVYRSEKYIYTECSTPWYYNSWLDDHSFNYSVYLNWFNDDNNNCYNNISNNNTNNNKNNNNNNNNSKESTVCPDIEGNIEVAELSPPGIKITRRHAPFLLVMFTMLGSVIAFHIYALKASLCQQILEASVISWAMASLVLILLGFLKQIHDFCHSFLNN